MIQKIRNIHVDVLNYLGKAAASWETGEAVFHVWFDVETQVLEKNRAGKSVIYKNPLNGRDFNTRHLKAEKHARTLKYVFEVINREGLIANARIGEENDSR